MWWSEKTGWLSSAFVAAFGPPMLLFLCSMWKLSIVVITHQEPVQQSDVESVDLLHPRSRPTALLHQMLARIPLATFSAFCEPAFRRPLRGGPDFARQGHRLAFRHPRCVCAASTRRRSAPSRRRSASTRRRSARARIQRAGIHRPRIGGPGMPGVASAELGAHLGVGAVPEPRKVVGDLHGSSRR